jgi:RimJ/RimL family protein N-acetyltransferase
MSILQTPRLALRELDFGDGEFILELLNEPGFLRHIGDKGVRSVADARDYILKGPMDSYARNGFGLYAACLSDGTPIGICGLVRREGLDHPDVGFAFLERYCSKGYAVESAAAVLTHAETVLNLEHIVAITSPENAKSIAVLEKIGFQFSRMLRLAADTPELNLFVLNHAGSRR